MYNEFFTLGELYRSLHTAEKMLCCGFDKYYAIFNGVDTGIIYKVGKQKQPYYMYKAIKLPCGVMAA